MGTVVVVMTGAVVVGAAGVETTAGGVVAGAAGVETIGAAG